MLPYVMLLCAPLAVIVRVPGLSIVTVQDRVCVFPLYVRVRVPGAVVHSCLVALVRVLLRARVFLCSCVIA